MALGVVAQCPKHLNRLCYQCQGRPCSWNWDLCFLAVQRSASISSLQSEGYLQNFRSSLIVWEEHVPNTGTWSASLISSMWGEAGSKDSGSLVWVLSGQWDPSLQKFILPFERQLRETPNSGVIPPQMTLWFGIQCLKSVRGSSMCSTQSCTLLKIPGSGMLLDTCATFANESCSPREVTQHCYAPASVEEWICLLHETQEPQ